MGEKPVFFVKSGKMEKLKIEWKAFAVFLLKKIYQSLLQFRQWEFQMNVGLTNLHIVLAQRA